MTSFERKEPKVKRPRAVTESIIAIAVLSFFAAFVVLFMAFPSSLPASSRLPMLIVFAVPLIVGVLDLMFLLIRMKWVYYYNLVIQIISAIVFLICTLQTFRPAAKTLAILNLGIVSKLIYGIPALVLAWICVELIMARREVIDYLARNG
jgi:hypothetical protein